MRQYIKSGAPISGRLQPKKPVALALPHSKPRNCCRICGKAFTPLEWKRQRYKRVERRAHTVCLVKVNLPALMALSIALMVMGVVSDGIKE